MEAGKFKALELGNRVINNPRLLEQLDEDTLIKFVVCIAKYNKSLASQVFDLRYNEVSAQGKVLFWEAVGILTKQEDYV